MIPEELSKIPFRCVCHAAFEDEHTLTYISENGRFGFCMHTPKLKNGRFGKGRTHYQIDGKVYKSRKKFLEALKDFDPKIIPIRKGI